MNTEATKIHSYRNLIVWQKAMDLVTETYALTRKFPREELYGIVSQMRRSALSIPSNIAEGRARGGRKELRQFFITAYASGAELETQIEISKRLILSPSAEYKKVDSLLLEVMKMLNKMISNLRS